MTDAAPPRWCRIYQTFPSPDGPATEVRRALALLSPAERARHDAFPGEGTRCLYRTSRVLLRTVLSREMGIPPDEVTFVIGTNGRPELAPPRPLRFNLTHTDCYTALVVTRSADCGIDAEWMNPLRNLSMLGPRVLSEEESAANPSSIDLYGWLLLKEAYAKASGLGVRIPYPQLRIDVGHDESGGQCRVHCPKAGMSEWRLFRWEPAAEHVAAAVVRGAEPVVFSLETVDLSRC